MPNPICIYHHNCPDGFAAAWVVREALLGQVDFYPGIYGHDAPDVAGRDVILVDFSYSRPVLMQMVEQAHSLTIIDHHLSAQEAVTNLPGAKVVFAIGMSGCMLAWRHYFAESPAPRLLQHIQDRDLWTFYMDATRDVVAGLFSHPYDFDLYGQWMRSANLAGLAADGAAINRKQQKDLAELLPQVTRQMLIGAYLVPVANLPYTLASEAAGELAKDAVFAACYWDTAEGRQFSLRSRARHGADVSRIAEEYGGGGHRHAAGFRLSRAQAADMEKATKTFTRIAA